MFNNLILFTGDWVAEPRKHGTWQEVSVHDHWPIAQRTENVAGAKRTQTARKTRRAKGENGGHNKDWNVDAIEQWLKDWAFVVND